MTFLALALVGLTSLDAQMVADARTAFGAERQEAALAQGARASDRRTTIR